MENWTCEEYQDFNSIRTVYVCTSYASKSIQMLVFVILLCVLVYDKVKAKGQIGKLPIFVVFLAIVNSVFAIIRVNALFPHDNDAHTKLMAGTFCVEGIAFFGATWFFSIKYFETALDIENISSPNQDTSKMTESHKRKWLIFRWLIFLVIICAEILCAVAFSASIGIELGRTMLFSGYSYLIV